MLNANSTLPKIFDGLQRYFRLSKGTDGLPYDIVCPTLHGPHYLLLAYRGVKTTT